MIDLPGIAGSARWGAKKRARAAWYLALLFPLFSCTSQPESPARDAISAETHVTQPPSLLFGDLFEAVAMSGHFADSKQWADAVPRRSPAEILERSRGLDTRSSAALQAFLDENFVLNPAAPSLREPTPGLPLREHISELWTLLTRQTVDPPPYSSHLPLPHPYVVPGGRFQEVYYWDSYFTMLGFGPAQAELKRDMVANFAHQIRTYGHIPNGNRTYYLSRSQPPFFFRMVGLLAPDKPALAFAEYLPELKAEHAFWMQDSERVKAGEPVRRVVRMPDGSLLNRYWDARDVPRDESFREDVEVAKSSRQDERRLYRDIRAAAESGWDFSSRWLADGESLQTIQTTAIVPVDLNSLLYGLEQAIAQGCRVANDLACVQSYEVQSAERRAAMHRYLWNEGLSLFDDYHWPDRRLRGHITAATLYPLFVGLATGAQAARVAEVVGEELVRDGGVVSTNRTTGEQWDAPNGWAPLQWIAVTGLRRYEHDALAETIARRWLQMVSTVYAGTGKLLEKYDVVTLTSGGGGEYPLQDGFGWTNGVTTGLLRMYPCETCPAADETNDILQAR
jgi:alpha,alpha-trehalase